MLNLELYKRLKEQYKKVNVLKEGTPVTYIPPVQKNILWKKKSKQSQLPVTVTNWGETYQVNCPVCGDTRQRLSISHVSGVVINKPKTKSMKYRFPILVKCFNEECQTFKRKKLFRNLNIEFPKKAVIKEMLLTSATCSFIPPTQATIPELLPLESSSLSDAQLLYIYEERGWDLNILNQYGCAILPQTSIIGDGDKKRFTKEDRLFIPITLGCMLFTWQARILRETKEKKVAKYLFPSGCSASKVLYNMDNAVFHRDIVICEGITDVWRVGNHAVALFGKSMSSEQLEIMKILWGGDGQAIIMLDSDAIKEAFKIKRRLEKHKVFPRGVVVLELPEGTDPGILSTKDLKEIEQLSRETLIKKEI